MSQRPRSEKSYHGRQRSTIDLTLVSLCTDRSNTDGQMPSTTCHGRDPPGIAYTFEVPLVGEEAVLCRERREYEVNGEATRASNE